MIRALSNAASGMKAQEMNIDVLSNNLANVNTTGYKKSRAEFSDLFYEQRKTAGSPSAAGGNMPVGTEVGHGVRTAATYKNFSTGDLISTSNPLDIAIEGKGFFQVVQPNGEIAFTRNGMFKTNSDGQLVSVDGYEFEPSISIPADATSITVSESGVVSVTLGGSSDQIEVGNMELASFQNPAGLKSIGNNLFMETPASGTPITGTPGEEGAGRLRQGFVEGSNVAVVTEMIDLISAQRAYEVNSKVIEAADEMLKQTTRIG
ncbi:MAG: flagellar basal-body rod protein FlgG [Deltaproteobacteria bacterium]|nr:flagellar basal-body rod protein FlgG [Deltaproteobacteria bacterium]